MTRWVSAANQTAAAAQSITLATFADLDFVGDRLRVHDGAGTISWGGNDWLGVGQYGGVDAVPESLEVIAQPVRLSLSGVDANLITDAMTTQYHGRAVALYVGLFSLTTQQLIDTPEEMWSGFMDVMHIEFDQNQASIRLDCEHRLRRIVAASRYTDEDQRTLYSGDLFFKFLHLIPGYRGKWGSRDTNFGGGMGGRDGPGPRNPRQEH